MNLRAFMMKIKVGSIRITLHQLLVRKVKKNK